VEDEARPRTWWRSGSLVVAVLLVLGTASVLALRLLEIEVGPLAYAVSLVPWFLPVTFVALVLALLGRSRATALVAAGLLLLQAWWLLPLYTARAPAGGRPLVIASSNIRFGDASAVDLTALVRDKDLDVLVVLELTPEAMRRLEGAGLDRLLPNRYAEPAPGVQGTGIWSRLPLSATGQEPGFFSRTLRAFVTVDAETGAGLNLIAAHPVAPGVRDNNVWRDEHALLLDLVESGPDATALVGDLNATRDHAVVQRYESAGYADAADEAGAGFVPTFPVGRSVPPVVAIDHVLMRSTAYVADTFEAVDITDTDHRAVIATYRFR
jgi:endonuclease/exonuclease/phosphatase (EEP) superfamily protein YafD